MQNPSTVFRTCTVALLIATLALTTAGCRSIAERLIPQPDPQATQEPVSPTQDASPATTRPVTRPVPRAERPTGVISTQPGQVVASEVIDSSGGTVTVVKPGDPIDGLVLEVPEGAYSEPNQFEIYSAPVSTHTFGDNFNPLSPLITIENGGDYSNGFMTVTVPIDLPEGWFAMPFYYDEATGRLEGIPFHSLTNDSITVVTRHFSDFLISGILNSHIEGLIEEGVDSGFRPGADDWQFTNYGSYIAPGGHCAGQALTALWYYCEQPDGQDPFLWGLYDNNGRQPWTPDLWEDDSYGYRLASTIQEDIDWNSFQNELMYNLRGADDELAFKAFAYGMHLTGEPQEVGIFSSAGGGHDMIVYRVDTKGLAIADPNYPGNTSRRIEYSNGSFSPYHSGANATEIAAGNGKAYETIQYCAKSATIDWNQIAARWDEFKAGTIGNDRFPSYEVVVIHDDDTEEPLVDGYESEHAGIRISVSASNVPIAVAVQRNGTAITRGEDRKYELEEGGNLIGIAIWGDVDPSPRKQRWKYIDYQYFTVTYGESDCNGWVLDSIVVKEYQERPSDISRETIVFEASEHGSFTGTGRYVLSAVDNEYTVNYSSHGTWGPIPRCLDPNEPIRIDLRMESALASSSDSLDWGTVFSHLRIQWDHGQYGDISHAMRTGDPPQVTTDVAEFQVWEGPGTGYFPPIVVNLATDSGWAVYEYHYVWRD